MSIRRGTVIALITVGCAASFFLSLFLFFPFHDSGLPKHISEHISEKISEHIQPWVAPKIDWVIPKKADEKPREPWPVIPNIVHYVYLMKDVNGDMNLKFEDFLSVYSALHYFDPETIYIHTDASIESLERVRDPNNKKGKWTRKIFDLPRVTVRYGTAPEVADNGVEIKNLPNRSDFLRAKVVHELGGIYFDFDVFALRDFKPFREAGFANVVGLEKYEKVGSGCYMAIKGSELMRVWLKYEHIVYDGGWITHAVELLTKLARRAHRIPYEVLILDKKTWCPVSWEVEEAKHLFGPHPSAFPLEPSEADFDQDRTLVSSDLESILEKDGEREDWQFDWSTTYAIHAFKSEPEKIENFEGYSVQYILSRKSNLARALYPAITHAIEEGYISTAD